MPLFTLISLSFGMYFNQPVDFLVKAPNLKFLSFDMMFNQPISIYCLPPSLTHLVLGSNFTQPISSFPPTLTHLSLGVNFNHPLPPLPNLIHLNFGSGYKLPIPPLPPSLTHLLTSDFLTFLLIFLHLSLMHTFVVHSTNHSPSLPIFPTCSSRAKEVTPVTVNDSLACLIIRYSKGSLLHFPPGKERKFSHFYHPGELYRSLCTLNADQVCTIVTKKPWENCDDFSNY
jgi:FNIP Repeat